MKPTDGENTRVAIIFICCLAVYAALASFVLGSAA